MAVEGSLFYRAIFFEAHPGDRWRCEHCEKWITKRDGFDSDALVVHHRDEDRTNNALSNLAPMHFGCHKSHHGKGKPKSDETRRKMSEYHSHRTPEHQAKLNVTGATAKGRPKSESHKQAQRDMWARRTPEERAAIGAKIAAAHARRRAS